MNNKEKSELFFKYRPLAFRLAGRYAGAYGIPQHELTDEALSILGETVARWDDGTAEAYDPARSCPTSWVYRTLSWGISTHCTKWAAIHKRNREAFTWDEVKMGSSRNRRHLRDANDAVTLKGGYNNRTEKAVVRKAGWLETTLRDLGEDARILIETIINAPAEIATDLAPRTRAKGRAAVRNYLETQKGWSASRLQAAWTEVEVAI